MYRAIFVPKHLVGDGGELPEEATRYASQSHLQIVLSDDAADIHIGVVPHEKRILCDNTVRAGFAHVIEIVDEFIAFSSNYAVKCVSPSGAVVVNKPRIRERHKLVFVSRFDELGTWNYSVVDTELSTAYSEGTFEVV